MTNVEARAYDDVVDVAEEPNAEGGDAAACLRTARRLADVGDFAAAYRWLGHVADFSGPFVTWASAGGALAKLEAIEAPPARRTARVALAGSYTTSQLVPLLRLAALRRGVRLEIYETGFDLYTQEILDPSSRLYAFEADYVVIAPHEGAVRFPALTQADDVDAAIDAELARWLALWDAVRTHSSARVVQHTFAIRPETAWGHVSGRVPGTREAMLRALNVKLGHAAGFDALTVDCERIAAEIGKSRWFDDRYWHLAKQAVGLDSLPTLARHTAAVIAGAEGLSCKCVALDLDNTLWGGVIAEDGLAGIELGNGARGEAFTAFHDYLLALRSRGIVLAVASKNNEADAREPFEKHPDTRLRLDHFASFHANWNDKPSSLRAIAAELNIGLDSIVFVDDNPAEREIVRQFEPEVEVLQLPSDPSGYVRALSDSLLFEMAAVTSEDLGRAEQYQARAAAAAQASEAGSLEEFYASLEMEALVAPFDELNLPRITQLIGKTNQFNVTTRRHSAADVRAFMDAPESITMYLRLRDRFADHGLVAVLIAQQEADVIDIDTWLMSCRVIGRTVENEMLSRLTEIAAERGASKLRGTFVPTAKNAVVKDIFERFGFTRLSEADGVTTWEYDIEESGVLSSEFIRPWTESVANA